MSAPAGPLLEVGGLSVDIPVSGGTLHAVQNVDLEVGRGETLAIVGESGCGKSLTSLALMGLLPTRAHRRAERLALAGEDLLRKPERAMADLRGNRMAMVFQEPMTALNPAYTVGDQLSEPLIRHQRLSRRRALTRAGEMLERVGIPGAGDRLGQYPHQLSGGLRQRVMIAMALICGPDLVIADEPTTALDVTVQAQILALLADLQREMGAGLILITHDLGIVARVAHRVAVMYAGQVVETAPAARLFQAPHHPYTRGLLDCLPAPGRERGARLGSIPGVVPSLVGRIEGCHFADRCPRVRAACRAGAIGVRTAGGGAGGGAGTGPDHEHRYRCLLSPGEVATEAA